MKIYETKDGTVIEVVVKPHSWEFKIVTDQNDIAVFCKEQPVKGKVNRELIREFAELFHNKVELVSGFTSKQKKLLINGIDKNEVEHVLLHK